MAAGRMGQIDRAFATFKEYKTLFNLCPDVHAFNSLLYACASFRDTNINTLLSVLQNMETENVAPNSYSFSIMLQTMADCEDLSSLEPVLDVVEDNNHSVRTRALRCVAVTAAKQGDCATIERIRKHCVSQEMPELKFLQSRIKSLVNSQARVQLNSLVQ
jgi:PPR repeat family